MLVAVYPLAAWWVFLHGGLLGTSALWTGAVPQVFCYIGLFWLFARSLGPKREPLITRIARLVHEEVSVEREHYTRQVTLFWTVFFAVMALTSVFLLIFVSVDAWLIFANVLNLPILVCAFIGEYVYRLLRHPHLADHSLTAPIRAYRRYRESAEND